MKKKLLICFISFVALTSCTKGQPKPQSQPFVSYLSLAQLMQWVIDPAADRVWDSVAWYSTLKGEKVVAPHTEAEWEDLRNATATLMEASNLLMMDKRAQDNAEWNVRALALGAAAQKTLAAVEAKDLQSIFDTGTQIDSACEACHLKYAYFNKKN